MKKWLKKNKKTTLLIFSVFIIWQIAIAGIIFVGEKYFPTTYQYLYTEQEKIINPPIFWSRANFDGIHYLDIARKGYGIYQQAFFPLYPGMIKFLTPYFWGRALTAGLFISWLSFLAALFFFYKLARLDFDERIARRSLVYLLLFPTAFFFSAVYTESLFLFFLLGSFYFARKGNWWLAGILGALSSATRLAGIFLLPALLWEWWEQQKVKSQKLKVKSLLSLISILFVPLGLLFYMRFLATNYQDPLMFLRVQPAFGAERVADKIIPLYQVFWRYLKMVATTQPDPLYFTVWLEFLTAGGFLGLLIFGYLKKIRFSYLIFASLAYITPTLTGTFLSMPRFVLVLFPCFMVLALIENKSVRWGLIAVGCLLLATATILFTRGYFVG